MGRSKGSQTTSWDEVPNALGWRLGRSNSAILPKAGKPEIQKIASSSQLTEARDRARWFGSYHTLRRPDCLAGHVRLELGNVVANYPFERSLRFLASQRIPDTETIRV
jgi:hypothetical protein